MSTHTEQIYLGDFTLRITFKAFGEFSRASHHSPATAPEIEIKGVENVDERASEEAAIAYFEDHEWEAKEKLTETLR